MNNNLCDTILLSHGSGGRKSGELISGLFLKYFGNPVLNALTDSSVLDITANRIAFTTDSFVVEPLFFPGADIGKLAICGTINDLASSGAKPIAISAAFILEEGLDTQTLERIVISMKKSADEAGVCIVTGDTKVVPKGSADKIFVTTSGIGVIENNSNIPAPSKAEDGDVVILSGTIADHGMAVMIQREGIEFASAVKSDCAPLYDLVKSVMDVVPNIHCLRDPTRGGVAATLNEIAQQSNVCIEIDEEAIPLNPSTNSVCELLGIDPLHVANEGKMIFILPQKYAQQTLNILKNQNYGKEASIIGEVKAMPHGKVHLKTKFGSVRILDTPSGDILPRIC